MNSLMKLHLLFFLTFAFFSQKAVAVDYQLPDVEGEMQSMDQYLGKWVVVNYWATWCGTCKKEFADLIALHHASKGKDIVVVGINFEEISAERLRAFVEANEIPFQVLRTKPIPKTPLGPVPAIPTTYIIDPLGKPVAAEVGIVTRQHLEDYIARQRVKEEYARFAASGV